MTARERLAALPARVEVKSKTALETEAFLKSVTFPQRSRSWNFDASVVTKARIQRARLLAQVGMDMVGRDRTAIWGGERRPASGNGNGAFFAIGQRKTGAGVTVH